MIRRLSRVALVALLLATAACAAQRERIDERDAAKLESYRQFAGEPVKDFHFWRLDSWDVLGDYELVIWTNTVDAYLLRLGKPCFGLDFAQTIAVTSTQGRVYSRFDSVLFEQQRCRITEIRPIDGKAFKAARREAAANER